MASNNIRVLTTPEGLIATTSIVFGCLFALIGALHPLGPGESRLDAFMIANAKKYSQFDEELLARFFFNDRRGGVFVDIGCAWPVRHSTTFYLDTELGWTGLAVDALSIYESMWKAERPDTTFRQYAVSDQSGGTIEFYQADWSGVSSLSEERAERFTNTDTVPIEVPAISMDDLLDQEGIERFDFLSMDIEGAELLALAGFDIERFNPALACIESQGADRDPLVIEYFQSHGYEPIEAYKKYDEINMWFRKR
jgi:FkbM family methyltransferase